MLKFCSPCSSRNPSVRKASSLTSRADASDWILTFIFMQILLLNCYADSISVLQPEGPAVEPLPLTSTPLAPALVVLGDSTVDVGVNNHLITVIKCNWAPYGRDFVYGNLTGKATGRFCNGKLISDFLAERFGLPYPLPHGDDLASGPILLQGINTASSGTGWYDGTATLYNVASLTKQIQWVKEWQHDLVDLVGLDRTATLVKDAVYIVSTGSNDWVNNYYNNLDLQYRYNKSEFRQLLLESVVTHIQSLYNIGARKIAIVNLPPLGCLPSQITAHGDGDERICVEWMQEDSRKVNEGLIGIIAKLKVKLHRSTLVILDAFTLITDASNNPPKYGLVETKRGCCGTGLYETGIFCTAFSKTCTNSSQYLFWDSYHPTEFFNKQAAAIFWNVLQKEMFFVPSSI